MKKLLDPRWIFIVNTLPIILLFFIGWSEFNIIKSFLSETELSLWTTFASSLLLLAILSLVYAILRNTQKKEIDIYYSIISLVVYTVYLCFYASYSDDFISWNVPRWLFSGNLYWYVGAFVMPTLIHSLLCLVVNLTPMPEGEKAWYSIVSAIFVPVAFYIFGVLLSPLWKGGSGINDSILIILIVIGIICFLFFLLRFIYILISDKKINESSIIFFKILIALVCPILGLMLNIMFDNLFGNFSSPAFFLLALLNGFLIILPSTENKVARLLMFSGRCITFVFTLYFWVVFLPFVPLSVIAILIFGAGFLMLTPLFLFVIHLDLLYDDFKYLKDFYSKSKLYSVVIGGFLILPVGISISYKHDRSVLFETLDYLYSPDYTKNYDLDAHSVLRTLDVVNENKSHSYFYSSTPFLSSYFKWIVLDNLNLSNNKTQLITRVFSDKTSRFRHQDELAKVGNEKISITDVQHRSQYDHQKGAWISWIDLSITNADAPVWSSEYITQIDLPDGCWISDYYLYVEGVKEMGILAEKKAATWVFSQIRNENRDPGMLHYISGNKVDFRVFPFQQDEVRYTGIEFIHKDPVVINIDGHSVSLGSEAPEEEGVETQIITQIENKQREVVYVSSKEKESLSTVSRQPYYHFVVDISNSTTQKQKRYISDIRNLLAKNLISKQNAKISYVGTYTETAILAEGWEDELKSKSSEGGFFLDRAIKKILFDSYSNRDDKYPLIVVLSDDFEKAIIYNDFADMKFTYPESDRYFALKQDSLSSYSLYTDVRQKCDSVLTAFPDCKVKAWPSAIKPLAYLPNDNLPSVVLNTTKKTLSEDGLIIKDKDWESALLMQGQWMLQTLYPQTADDEWLALVQNSFKSKVLTPLTSYIVVENEAQKAMLKKKQDEVLSGNRSLDLNDDTQRMSEPSIWVMLLLLGGLYLLNKRRINKRKSITN